MKRTLIYLILFLLFSPVLWAGTLRDNFDIDGRNVDDGNLGEWRRLGDPTAQWFVKDGELVSTSENACASPSGSIIIGDNMWENYELEIQFKIVDTFVTACRGPAAGFGVRVDDTSPLHGVSLAIFGTANSADVDNLGCEVFTRGSRNGIIYNSFMTEQGVWHTARIVVDGDRYQYFIDDEQLCDFQNNVHDRGGVNLFSRNAEVHFDNLRITGDTISDTVAVEQQAKLTTTWAIIKCAREVIDFRLWLIPESGISSLTVR